MSFSLSPAKQAYFELVWEYVRQVPYGKVVTYGQIAGAIPQPEDLQLQKEEVSVSRLVGSALAACPQDVPWHRVINAQGRVSNRPDASRQQALLEREGIRFYEGRVSLDENQWSRDNEEGEPKQTSLF